MLIKRNIAAFLLYFCITIFVVKIISLPYHAAMVWPAVGIGIALAFVWGIKVLPGLYFAQLLLNYFLNNYNGPDYSLYEFGISNVFISVSLIRAYFGAFLIRYYIGSPISLVSFQSIVNFSFFIGPLITFFSIAYFTFLKIILGFVSNNDYLSNFFNYWFGDFIGYLIFTPLTLMLISQPRTIWKPRIHTFGIPLLLSLIFVIFIYNQSQKNDRQKIISNLLIKNDIIASKIDQSNNWITDFINIANVHASIDVYANKYFNSFLEETSNLQAIVWFGPNQKQKIFTSKSLEDIQLSRINKTNFTQFLKTHPHKPNTLSHTFYNDNLKSLINILQLSIKNEIATIILVHEFTQLIKNLEKKYDISEYDLNMKLNLIQSNQSLDLVSSGPDPVQNSEKFSSQSPIMFHSEKWNLIMEPKNSYYQKNQSYLNQIIGKLGFLFVGLIGTMLLILTGRNTITDIQVNERTIDLDAKARDFKSQKQQYQKLIEQHPVILWRHNLTTNKITYISKKCEDVFGYPINDWLEIENFQLKHIHHDDLESVNKVINDALDNNTGFEVKYRFINSDASVTWLRNVVNLGEDKNFNPQLVGFMFDETGTQEAIEQKQISEKKYRTLFKYSADPLIIIRENDKFFVDSNNKALSLFGSKINKKTITLADISTITQPDGSNSAKRLNKICKQLTESKYISIDWSMVNANNETIICNLELIKLPKQENNVILANITDITKVRLHEKKINQLAYYDNLTKLPNREYFYSKFEYFHKLAIEKEKFGCIIYLDLDRFKLLNDSLGHQAGDELLKMVASRIHDVSKKNDFCSRLGGDEFIILTKKLEDSITLTLESSLVKSELILEALNEPYQLGDYEHYITPSIGVSVFPSDDATTDQIIHQADIAMYASKEKGKNTITIYQPQMVKLVSERLKIEKAIRNAFDKGEFQLYYQPQIDDKFEIQTVEALLRWTKSSKLNISTESLIDTIEEIGLTHELGDWVFEKACSQLKKWQSTNTKIKSVAINVSSRQFHQKTFVDRIKSIIENNKIRPDQIVIELTEAVLIEDMDNLIIKLNDLQEYGVRISLDDFGTGYSSLAYLKKLPINQLKIDKMFIHDVTNNYASKHIVNTIIQLAKSLNLELIAEGIETEEQFTLLKELGCVLFQGYYFSKPRRHNQLFSSS